MEPSFSIITVCLNEERNIERTLQSVLSQNCIDYEYIIKDGGSSDSTNQVIQKYLDKFENKGIIVKYIVSKDESLYDAMNIASEKAEGIWLNFMNAGDSFYDTDVLNTVCSKFVNTDRLAEADVLYGDNVIKDNYGIAINHADMSKIRKAMPFNHQAAFFRREAFLQYMYNKHFKIGADYDLILSLYESKKRFEYLEMIVSVYNLDGLTSTKFVITARERRDVRFAHGYADVWIISNLKMTEAYIKEWMSELLPSALLKYFNHFYKSRIKKYVNVSGAKVERNQ